MLHLTTPIISRLGSRALAGCARLSSLVCYTWYLVVSLALTGCGSDKTTIQEAPLPQRNPTTYEFNAPMDAVKNAINEARGEKWQDAQGPNQGGQLAWKGDGNPFAKGTFANAQNASDAYLCGVGLGYAVGTSRVYSKDGKGLTYYADFQIHLVPVNASKTRVDILTHDSFIEAGTEWHPFARAGIFVNVPATTIEEYQILLDVGKQLGDRNMPKLITPDPGSQTRKLRATRRR